MLELKREYRQKDSIDAAIAWINENYHIQDMSMTLVANQVSLNYFYFSSTFKERTGMSFVNYLKKVRIDKARELLDDCSLSVNEVAERVGFQNPRLFSKIFKEELGITPSDYQKKNMLKQP